MTPNNNEHDATKTNNKESIDVTYVENKEHERAQETPAESEQISEKDGNKMGDDIQEERTDVRCVDKEVIQIGYK